VAKNHNQAKYSGLKFDDLGLVDGKNTLLNWLTGSPSQIVDD